MIKLKDTSHGPVVILAKKEFLLSNPSSINKCNECLKSLETGLQIKFENFNQYVALLKLIAVKLRIPFLIE
ncbi:hypothetical protein ACTNDY_06545 [Tissierellaceae bacterium HCP3S3_D8]